MYRLDIYVAKKDGHKRIRNVAKSIPSFAEAERLCEEKNKDQRPWR